MLAREAQAARDALFVPALVIHADHRPPCPVGVVELVEAGHGQRQLHGEGMALQEVLDRVVVRPIPVLPAHDARDLAVMDGWVELFEVEDVAGDDRRIVVLPLGRGGALIHQSEHAVLDEAPRLLPNSGTVQPRRAAALGDGFIGEQDAPDDLIVVLHGVGEAQGQLLERLRS